MFFLFSKKRGGIHIDKSFERLNAIWGFEVTKCDVKSEIAEISNKKKYYLQIYLS